MSSYHFVLLWSCYTSTCCSIKSLNVWCCIWNLRIQLQELYVCSSSSFCSWDGETCLVGLYYNFSWQRQKKKHHVHAAAGWAMLILNGASAVSFTTQNVSKISRLGYLGHFILLRTRYKMSRRAPLLPILNGKCRPTTCGGWGDRMDSNDGGCVQSWMTGWLGSWTHRNFFFFFLLQRYWVTLEFFNLLSRYIYLPTYLSLSESHCKWWYLSINNLMKLVLLTYVCY